MRKYRFIYWTKKNDVLKEEQRHFYNYNEVLEIAKVIFATSNLNDLDRITVRRIYDE